MVYTHVFYSKMRYTWKNICISLFEPPKYVTYILLNLYNSYSHYLTDERLRLRATKWFAWDHTTSNWKTRILTSSSLSAASTKKRKKKETALFLLCSSIYKSIPINIDMYKILFNLHTNSEKELLLFYPNVSQIWDS